MSSLVIAVDAQDEPLTLDEAKDHLRVTGHEDDPVITNLIPAARQFVENYINFSLVNITYDYYLDEFSNEMELPKPPLASVEFIKYYDTEGDLQTLDTSIYTVDTYKRPGRIVLAYDQVWPSTRDIINAVNIRFISGYGEGPEAVPEAIRQAMLLLIGTMYEHRETLSEFGVHEAGDTWKMLLAPYAMWGFVSP